MTSETIAAFAKLDAELTGKLYAQCMNSARQQATRADVFDLMSNLYYLNDGGYSRLRISDNFTVHLAMGARAEIEFNWLYAEREIRAVNIALNHERLALYPLCAVDGCGFYHLDNHDYCASHG